ncbi:hypothetical protein B0X53_07440 [Helicobacter pylori]|nr:hypothetical protein B0X53_07440 [Helicobacter pylori]
MKTHKTLLDKKFVLNSAIIGRSMFFSVFYLFGMACSSLLGCEFYLKFPCLLPFLKIVLKAVSAIKNTAGQYFFNLR